MPWECGIDVNDADVPLPGRSDNNVHKYIRAILAVPRDGKWYQIESTPRVSMRRVDGYRGEINRYFRYLGYTKNHVTITWRTRLGLCVRWFT